MLYRLLGMCINHYSNRAHIKICEINQFKRCICHALLIKIGVKIAINAIFTSVHYTLV